SSRPVDNSVYGSCGGCSASVLSLSCIKKSNIPMSLHSLLNQNNLLVLPILKYRTVNAKDRKVLLAIYPSCYNLISFLYRHVHLSHFYNTAVDSLHYSESYHRQHTPKV